MILGRIGNGKFRIFWEGHKVRKNLPLKICRYWVASNFKWNIFFKFCGLLRISKLYKFKIQVHGNVILHHLCKKKYSSKGQMQYILPWFFLTYQQLKYMQLCGKQFGSKNDHCSCQPCSTNVKLYCLTNSNLHFFQCASNYYDLYVIKNF